MANPTPVPLPPSVFSLVATTNPGQPQSLIATLNPLVAPPPPANINSSAATIQQAIASDQAANTPGTTALQPPPNFAFTDLTVNVSSTTPGDAFKGTTPGIASQFIDLTPDNLLITATAPNVFIKSDTGNDILTAQSGRNILSAGSGVNTFIAGSGQDTFLADASNASAVANVLNFRSSDDVAMRGVNLTDFAFTAKDTLNGLAIDADPVAAANKISAEIVLQGYTVADIGTRLFLGIGSAADSSIFVFVHAN